MGDPALAAREHTNYIESIGWVAGLRPEGVVRRQDGVALLASGVAMRLFNQVMIEDEATATEAAVADAVGTLRTKADRYIVQLRNGLDDRFAALLGDLGLVQLDGDHRLPGMALEPIARTATKPIGLDIRIVTDVRGFDDHVRTAALGFGLGEALVRTFLDVRMLEHPDSTFYVGYLDGQPLATGLGFRTGDTIGVYNISTIEAARRRGFGAAMTARIAADGAAAGCVVAILQASQMGMPVYEQLGYRTVVDYVGYVDPPAPEPAPA